MQARKEAWVVVVDSRLGAWAEAGAQKGAWVIIF